MDLQKLTELRRIIHSNPEISEKEFQTRDTIKEFLKENTSAELHEIAESGLIADFNSGKPGKTVMFRSELDALPIEEEIEADYKSKNKGISHKCGHDGHMAILCGLALKLEAEKLKSGRIILLFQPAEEIGSGSQKVLDDPKFKDFEPDEAYALHNIPGYEKGNIIVRNDSFTAAVESIIIKLKGKTSHAAEPENGKNPATVIADLVKKANELTLNDTYSKDFALAVPVYMNLGEKTYGTSAGKGEIHLTIRAWSNENLKKIKSELEKTVKTLCDKEGLKYKIDYTDTYFANTNDEESVEKIRNSAQKLKYNIVEKERPFKWGEDFGTITQKYEGAMFGLGSGKDTPKLHNPDYDFPDDIIEVGVNMFYSIAENSV